MYEGYKKKAKNTEVSKKDTKGFFPYDWMSLTFKRGKEVDTVSRELIKLSPDTVDLLKLEDLTYGRKDKLDLILEKNRKGEKLTKTEKMKLDNYLSLEERKKEDDLRGLESIGLKYIPKTNIGRIRKILLLLKEYHMKNNVKKGLEIYLKLLSGEFNEYLDSKLKNEFKLCLKWLEKIASDVDMTEYQLLTKYELMPPLNEKGFNKLDDWQKDTIKRMNEKKSLILSIPTSGGKTYLSAYLTKLGPVLFIAPSTPLARQVSAYLSRVVNKQVPLLTETWRTKFYYKDMLEEMKRSDYVVATPKSYLDYLPELGLFNKENGTLVLDEIHMMGDEGGDAMESIAILNSKNRLVGLSATISNPKDLIEWRKNMGEELEIIVSKKRFFNLQVSYWDSVNKRVMDINPLALLNVEEILNKEILKKELKPTSPDVYHLSRLMSMYYDLGELSLDRYFNESNKVRYDLNMVLEYFNKLIKFMVDNGDRESVSGILGEFIPVELDEEECDLVDIVMELKERENLPVLIFQRNTYSLLRLVNKFLSEITRREDIEYPSREKELLKQEKAYLKQKKLLEKNKIVMEFDEKKSKQQDRKMDSFMKENEIKELVEMENYQKPSDRYRFSNISGSLIEEYHLRFKRYFPDRGDYMHPIIHALWRGIGIYAEGLPEEYLILVQILANEKKLSIVLSDKSMTFGVSMPFRNVIIYRDINIEDELNPLLFKQMEGRAGRRGHDTKGSVIFVGYNWERIKELTVSEIPSIKGRCSIENIYLPLGQQLSELYDNEMNFKNIFKYNLYRLKESIEESEIEEEWNSMIEYLRYLVPKAFDDKELLKMLWRSRTFSMDGIMYYHIVDMLEREFITNDVSELRQIEASKILLYFVQNEEVNERGIKLELPRDDKWRMIKEGLRELLKLIDDEKLDGMIYESIKRNKLYECENDMDFEKLRTRFIKFSNSLLIIQNYCYYSDRKTLTRILGKLFTRCKWIINNSSPINKI